MAIGQDVLTPIGVMDRALVLQTRLECGELDRGATHVRMLRDVLELHGLFSSDGLGIATVSQVALSIAASEARAARLLAQGQALRELPGALEAVECGLLTVEQSTTVIEQLAVLDLPGRLAVWRRLQDKLIAEADAGVLCPPARLTERLRRWVVQHDRDAAAERRRQAEKTRAVSWRKRDDGLADLFAFGFRPPELQAILQRLQDLSAPFGADDDRTADQRRFDALKDVLLGRYDRCRSAASSRTADSSGGCDCRPGEHAPCGAQMSVLVPIGAALRTTNEVAETVGHGPIEPDLLEALLLNRPWLRAVFVDDQGVPLATSDRVLRPERGDPASVRRALLELAAMTPSQWHPRHPEDHPPDDPPDDPIPDDPLPGAAQRGRSLRRPRLPDPRRRGGSHPVGQSGAYAIGGRLRRLTFLRAPRCEFPGCGVRAVRCDAEHDVAHPTGPSCACNIGPLCRRHHRIKQLLFAKTRTLSSAVVWSCRTGQSWTSPSQHAPPAAAVRPLPSLPSHNPLDELSPLQLEHELWQLGLLPDDDAPLDLRAPDVDPRDVDPDPLNQCGQPRDTTWSLDLADPYLWAEPPA